MAIEIVDLPIKNGDFPISFLYVDQAGFFSQVRSWIHRRKTAVKSPEKRRLKNGGFKALMMELRMEIHDNLLLLMWIYIHIIHVRCNQQKMHDSQVIELNENSVN